MSRRVEGGGGTLRPFEAAVLRTLRARRLLAPGARVLAALSGGPDSTALVAALAALRDARYVASVHACHVDHGLRAGSADDGAACEALCRALAVPLDRVAVRVAPGRNLQSAARAARYRALRAAAARAGAERIATGHTRGDQAETVLLRLLRGAGARGLAGIPARRGRIVRPLLDRSRAEVVAYLRERGLSWREDPTNASPRFLRNRVRAELLPALEALAPGVEARLARSALLLRADDRALERLARAAVPPRARSIGRRELAALPLAVRRRAVRRLWRAAAGAGADLGADAVARILALARGAAPRRLSLPGGLEARASLAELAIGRPPPASGAAPGAPAPLRVDGPGAHALPGGGVLDIAWEPGAEGTAQGAAGAREAAPTPFPLWVRVRRAGDRFRPERGRGEKKLKAWLIDRKVPRAARDRLLLVVDGAGRVLAIPELGARGSAAGALRFALRGPADAAPG